jgi:hypothetical protein
MSKSSTPAALKKIHFNEDWNTHPAIEWLMRNKRILLWVFIGLLALIILAYRLASQRTLHAEIDFFRAQTFFTQFQEASLSTGDPTSAKSDLEQLEILMQKYPELKAKYEGPLAQILLMNGDVSQARSFAEEIFKRTQSDHLELYQEYSNNSLLIAEGLIVEALQRTQEFRQKLDQMGVEIAPPILYLMNLIRLAMLHQQLGQFEEEFQIWEQFQNQPQRAEALAAINQAYDVEKTSLSRYIKERKQQINPNEKE